jgi:beta-mannosidase
MGSLYWQLNDSWPTISWSTVDYYGRWKASHYAVRDANEAIILAPVEEEGQFKVFAVNDLLSDINGELRVKVLDFAGNEVFSQKTGVTANANTSKVVFDDKINNLVANAESDKLVVVVELVSDGQVVADNLFYFHRPKELKLPEVEVELSAKKTEKGYQLTLISDHLAKDVFLDTPEGEGFFTDNFFDLLPGESKVIELETSKTFDPQRDISITTLNEVQNLVKILK